MDGSTDSAFMATEPEGSTAEPQWLSQDTLREQQEQHQAVLPVSNARVEYRQISPQKFASLVDRFDIGKMAQDLGNVDPDTDLSDAGDVDLDELDASDLDDLDDKVRMILFFQHVVLPQIDRPEQVHWADPDLMGKPGWVDLSDLHEEDLVHLVAVISGQDADALMENAQDRIDKFR